jgi:hypothetical protein
MHEGLKQLFELFSFIDKINKKEKASAKSLTKLLEVAIRS